MFNCTMNFKSVSCVLLLLYLINSIDAFKLNTNEKDEKAGNATPDSLQSNITIVLPENISSTITQNLNAENVTNILKQMNGTSLNKTKGVLPNLNDFDTPLNYSYAASMLYPHYTKFYIEPTPKPQKSKIFKRLARPVNFVMQRKEKYFDVDPVPGEEDNEDNDGTRIKEDDSSKISDDKKSKAKKAELNEEHKSEEDNESEENKERVLKDEEQDYEGEQQEEDGEDDEDYEDEDEEQEQDEKNEEIRQKIIEKSQSQDSKEDAVDLSEDEAHVNYALSLDKNIPKTEVASVADSEAEGSKKEADHIIDHEHEKGGGKKHHAEHHGEHGEHGEKGYKGFHKDTKGAKGHHDKEAHKHHYDDQGGHEKQHHEEQGHHGEHHQGEKGSKHAEYEESGEHSKGHSTKGSHDIHKKDEYEKKVTFFEEEGDSGEEEKFGGYAEDHSHGKGGEFHKGHHLSKDFQAEKGDEKHYTEGGHHMDNKGHKRADGHSGHHAHHMEFGKKNGRDVGKKWGYAKGLGGDHRSAKIIQHRTDKGDLGHDGQASEHRRVIQKPKLYSNRPVHPYVEGAVFIQRRNDEILVNEQDSDANTNAFKQFPLESKNKHEPQLEATHFVQRRMDNVEEHPEEYIAEPEKSVENEQIVYKEQNVEHKDDKQEVETKQNIDNLKEAESEKDEKKVQVVKYEEEFENQPTDTVQETTKYKGYLVNEQAVESTRFGEQEPFHENKENGEKQKKGEARNTVENNGDTQNHQEIKRDLENQSDTSNSQESEQEQNEEPEINESRVRESEELQINPKAKITEYDDGIEDYSEGIRTDVKREDISDSNKGKLEIVDDEEEQIVHKDKSEDILKKEENSHANLDPKTVIIVEDDDSKKNISSLVKFEDDNEENNLYDEIVTRNKANDVAIPDDPGAQRRSQILKAEKEEYIRLAAQSRGKKTGKAKITGRGPRSTVPTDDKVQQKQNEVKIATVPEQPNSNSTKKNSLKKSKKRSKKAKSRKSKKKMTTTTEQPDIKEDSVKAVAGDSADFF